MAGFRIEGNTSGNVAEVNTANQIKVVTETNAHANSALIGATRMFSEIDQGLSTGTAYLKSPEVDEDYRLRVAHDVILDEEDISSNTQNFTKHAMYATTYVPTWSVTGFNTNPSSLLTAGAAVLFRTYKTFSIEGTQTLSYDIEGSFFIASGIGLPANTVIEFGHGLNAITTPYDCFDGAYMRTTNTGTYGIIRNNSITDTAVTNVFLAADGVSTWYPVSGRKYQFNIYVSPREVEYWINDPVDEIMFLAATIATPPGFGSPTASQAAPMWLRQYQQTAPTIASQFNLSRYNVRRGGPNIATGLGEAHNRSGENIYSMGTLTTTQSQTITAGSITRPAATVPINTGATLSSLGGIFLETGTLAIGVDAILMSFQVPALPVAPGAAYLPNKRLRVDGLTVASGVITAFATGGFQKHFYVAVGGTAASLAGVVADTATTKAYRRIHMPIMQFYTATHAPGQTNNSTATYYAFPSPVYVNPGEFIALVTYNAGTVGTVGVIQHAMQFHFSWE